jgi:hypothetical protein
MSETSLKTSVTGGPTAFLMKKRHFRLRPMDGRDRKWGIPFPGVYFSSDSSPPASDSSRMAPAMARKMEIPKPKIQATYHMDDSFHDDQ